MAPFQQLLNEENLRKQEESVQKQEALRRGRALAWELTGQGPRALLQALCFPSSVKQRAR